MSEFKFDDEIEGSDYADFKRWESVRFLADVKDSRNYEKVEHDYFIVAIDNDGDVVGFRYARPATPKILIDGIQYSCTKMQAARIAEIKKELEVQHKIITGEV